MRQQTFASCFQKVTLSPTKHLPSGSEPLCDESSQATPQTTIFTNKSTQQPKYCREKGPCWKNRSMPNIVQSRRHRMVTVEIFHTFTRNTNEAFTGFDSACRA